MLRVSWGFAICVLGLPVLTILIGGPAGVVVAGMITIFTGLATAIIGLPVYDWACARRCFSIWPFLAGGIFAGCIIALIPLAFAPNWKFLLELVKVLGSIGAVHGALFWCVAIWGNEELRGESAARDYATRKL